MSVMLVDIAAAVVSATSVVVASRVVESLNVGVVSVTLSVVVTTGSSENGE